MPTACSLVIRRVFVMSMVNIGNGESSPSAKPSWESGDNVIVGFGGACGMSNCKRHRYVFYPWLKVGDFEAGESRFQGRQRPHPAPLPRKDLRLSALNPGCFIPFITFPSSNIFGR